MPYKIREYRIKKQMTQQELADKAGVSRATISGLESGSITVTTTETIRKISAALGKKVGDIFLP